MIPFQNKDERLKIIRYIILILVMQSILSIIIFSMFVNNINNNIIQKSYEIVGQVYEKDKELGIEIIPIFTDKMKGNEILGKNILSQYSYDDSLSYRENPTIANAFDGYKILFLAITVGSIIFLIIGVIYFFNPLYKEVKYLTYRAENVIESRNCDKFKEHKYEGSLDKFILKFSIMEERIYNSISMLYDEKLNLKNIINDISHQLKTPLMALSMYNEILLDHVDMDNKDIEKFILLSKEQLERMEWLVKTLLKYARLESNVVEYHKEKFSMKNTIEESINPLIIKANEKNQRIEFKYDKDIVLYHDRKWIAEALSNIIKNAIEHTKNGGHIFIELYETPISVRISIKDNGEGIEKSEINKIFNRFYKGENSINPTSIGIGLCLSKAIIKAHNGDISVESEVGVGSTFYINFLKTINN
ncbi:sensor histidine kinase [Clostridium ihumii]|uniref:sensor histidine kinase n=1 Tax=Clostridium ihumii TaxID=1470356 RepID=UPI003D334C9E